MTKTTTNYKTNVKFRITYQDKNTGNLTHLYVYTESDVLKYTKDIKDAGYEILSRVRITEEENVTRTEIVTTF